MEHDAGRSQVSNADCAMDECNHRGTENTEWDQESRKAGRETGLFLLSCLPDLELSPSVFSVPLWLNQFHP
jgi:hypothetical protein